ncbi:hypothetical protein EDD86DRAFT_187976 [Gorgonomyces haynaldii]|nr:hypothetical protein EDD86DRAFT_187976 [Gorgonomyces haynaldii]
MLFSTLVQAQSTIPTLDTLKQGLNFQTTLYNDNDIKYQLFWNVTDVGTPNETLYFLAALTATTTTLSYPWLAIGFGDSMLRAQTIVCHGQADKAGIPEMHEHGPTGNYAPPPHLYDNEKWSMTQLRTVYVPGTQLCFFKRKTIASDPSRLTLNPSRPMRMIWAFNPASAYNYRGERFALHAVNQMGSFETTLATGSVIQLQLVSPTQRMTHGFGMMAVWLIIFPFGAYYARYFRSRVGWILVKVGIQSLGVVAVFSFALIMLTAVAYFDLAHSILGVTIICVMAIQAILGVSALLGLSVESMDGNRKLVRRFHRFTGAALLLAAAVQIGLGINIYFPWVEPRYPIVWILYLFAISFWIILFAATELLLKKRTTRKDPGYAPVPSDNLKSEMAVAISKLEDTGKNHFTWESLAEEVEKGAKYVVANGRYVYDVSKWIQSHPGGQIVLHGVIGTDITFDYFHEAGYDATQFTPMPTYAPRPGSGAFFVPQRQSYLSPEGSYGHGSIYSADSGQDTSVMTEEDWAFVMRARRTHVHSKLAIERLSTLVVGEILPNSAVKRSISMDTFTEEATFDPYEYRRYAITEVVSASSGARPAYKLRFCVLWPFGLREGTPRHLLPGQCVEIQARINGKYVSRFYSPIGDNLLAFEVIVRIVPGGIMSQFLSNQRPGDKQIKIRGPFGRPLANPQYPIGPANQLLPETVFFIAGGSGITPFLQLINFSFFSVKRRLQVNVPYLGRSADELDLQPRQVFVSKFHYYDGWAMAYNLSTQKEGLLPLSCTVPLSGRTKFVLINCIDDAVSAIGMEIVNAAALTFPHNMEIHHFISTPGNRPPNMQGSLYEGRLREVDLKQLLDAHWKRGDMTAQKVFVCGSDTFNSCIVDLMFEYGCTNEEMTILPAKTFVH